MDAAKAKQAVQARKAADAARAEELVKHLLALIASASQAGRQYITDPLGIIQPPVTPAQRAAAHKVLRAKGFRLCKTKHGETHVAW